MASVTKFQRAQVYNQIRHIERTIANPGNKDIDPDKLGECYSLSPDRGMSAYTYYKDRLDEVYVYGRGDVVTAMGWVITCPTDVPAEMEDMFFRTAYDFLTERYGEKNCIQCAVHKDESGSSHMHYLGIPVTYDTKRNREKCCANDVLSRRELRDFHPALQQYLKEHGCPGTVMSGITKAIGGNREVKELKVMREQGITLDKQAKEIRQPSRWRTADRDIERTR